MLLKLAWRNIWRNKRHSAIVVGSVIVGVIAVILMDGLTSGMLYQMLFNQISSSVSHIQIHKKGFNDNKVVQSFMPDYYKAEDVVKENTSVQSYSKKVVSFGLLSSASSSSGVFINGINPSGEEKVTKIKNSIVEGSYLTGNKREIVIGKDLADKLNSKLGDKVVILTNTPDGTISSDVFRIVGTYETFSSAFDKAFIYIPLENAQQMLNIGDNIHELAIITKDYGQVDKVKEQIASQLSDEYEVLSYEDMLPMLLVQIDLYKQSMFITDVIIGLALIFGIINVMLMAVFERIQEFGVLMSIGMKNSKLFLMIIIEALIIGIIGTVVGIVIGIIIEIPLSYIGIDLSLFAESLKSFGSGAIIYPVIVPENLIGVLIIIPFISIVGAIYPAYKAIKLEPVSAIRYV
ncbi:MAG: ABC transporter permease [Ignavibacteria bacterium]|nr:ABC transporter permease [Ignavibacteria bacterium]